MSNPRDERPEDTAVAPNGLAGVEFVTLEGVDDAAAHVGTVPVAGVRSRWWRRLVGRRDSYRVARFAPPEPAPGEGLPIILLHEALGPSPATLALAQELRDGPQAFTVYVPAIFGAFGKRRRAGVATTTICMRREFALFRTGRTSPVTEWLRELVRCVSEEHGRSRVGVIGMCLTGGLAMALLAEPKVTIAVAAQPSLPVAPRALPPDLLMPRGREWSFAVRTRQAEADLGLSPGDAPGDDDGHLVVLRYDRDWICPRRRTEEMVGVSGGTYDEERSSDLLDVVSTRPPGAPSPRHLVRLRGRGHSTLTGIDDDRAAVAAARALVAEWLGAALAGDENEPR